MREENGKHFLHMLNSSRLYVREKATGARFLVLRFNSSSLVEGKGVSSC